MNFIRRTSRLLAAVITAGLLAGCAIGGGETRNNAEPVTIKVMYYDERSFFDQYGMLFSALYPEIGIEVVNTQSVMRYDPNKDMDQELYKLIDEQKPDILMLSPEQYTRMSGEGKLMELTSRVEEKGFDKEGIVPGMIDYLKDLSGGVLYGLVPNFYSQAIYYNKDLFAKYGVEPPTDKMSWEDLFRLAAMFPTDGPEDARVYGLNLGYMGSDLYQLGSSIGMTHNLNFIDTGAGRVTINFDSWKKVFETALAALKSGSLYTEMPDWGGGSMQYEDYLLRDPFISGKVAMSLDGTYLMDQIKEAQDVVKDKAVKNWDLVTVPVDPANPDVSPHVNFSNIFAISAQSAQADAAWTFLRYVHSDEYARVTSKRRQGNLSVRTQYLKDEEGHHFEAFYALRPVQAAVHKNYDKIPRDFLMNFQGMAQQELQAVYDGQKPLGEALDSLQAKAQEALILANQKKESQGAGSTNAGG